MLAWMSLGLVALVLYLFRRKPRRVAVSTLIFFKALAREHQEASWLRKLKRLLSLLLTLLIIVAGSLALARAVLSIGSGQVEGVVILVDRSASMAAKDSMGRSRLAEALERIRQRVASLPSTVEVSVIAYDERPEIMLPLTFDRRLLPRTLDALSVRPMEGRPGPALDLAREVANLRPQCAIWHYTDRSAEAVEAEVNPKLAGGAGAKAAAPPSPVPASPGPASPVPGATAGPTIDTGAPPELAAGGTQVPGAQGSGTNAAPAAAPTATAAPAVSPAAIARDPRFFVHENVALSGAVNVGITAFQLRKPPLQQGRYELFAEVLASAPAGTSQVEAKLDLVSNRRLISTRRLTLKPGVPEKFVMPLPVTADAGTLLEAQVSCEGDALALDGYAFARIPPSKPLEVLWITPDASPFTSLALSSLSTTERELRVLQGTPATWPPRRPVDVVIFDGWVPEKWPETPGQAAIVINPPGSSGPVRVQPLDKGAFVDAVRVTREKHPVLHGVASGRISLTQSAVVDASGSLEPLWQAPAGPLLAAGEWNGQRIVILGFNAERSERLPLMASWPLLLGNAIYWAAQPRLDAVALSQFRSGDVVRASGTEVTWTLPDNRRATAPIRGQVLELDRLGWWETSTPENAGAPSSATPGASISAGTLAPGSPAAAVNSGSSSLLSRRATLLSQPLPGEVAAPPSVTWVPALLRGDLVPAMLALLVLVLIAESWLFHRHSVH